ncbi:MAG: DNA repair protein RecN [Alphaproteobacteria bacterium]|nr:DNA repair protein RecN [Alphaproteobacteria bacterium]
MLTRLTIQDVVLIDRLTVPFEDGLNVFTGETGAGKSILLDALALALGARSDASLIRSGQEQACVTAEFSEDLPAALLALLDQHGLIIYDPLILRRTISKDGKSRAYLCDQPIGVTLLRRVGELLLEVHGQFETHGLLNPATHRDLLDSFAGCDALRDQTADSFAAWKRAQASFDEAQAAQSRARDEEEFLRVAVAEIDALAPCDGEVEKLAQQRQQLQHRDKILDALIQSELALSGDKGAITALAQAGKVLARVVDKAPELQDVLTIIDRANADLDEASHLLARHVQTSEDETLSLDAIEERLFRLRAIARKHGTQAENLADVAKDLRSRLALLNDQGDHLTHMAKLVATTLSAYKTLAQKLSTQRARASVALSRGIMQELAPLKLERAVFTVQCETLPENQWGADGMDRVTFLAATNKGSLPSPLQKVASGGELARFMLAIKVVLSKAAPVPTLVFDEVDAGIGGATASAVGERLAVLGQSVQVLVVTHSPQIAARGTHHLRVIKQDKGKFPTTLVAPLTAQERIEEIARMLAGAEITDAARKAAISLLHTTPTVQPAAKRKAKA